MKKRTVLLVEDEDIQRMALQEHLSAHGYNAVPAATAEEAMKSFMRMTVDGVITDFNLPGKDGIDLLQQIRSVNPGIPVIIITAYGTIDHAVNAMKKGAYDYLTKPVNIEELLLVLKRALEHGNLISENIRLKEALKERFAPEGIVAASGRMQEVLNIAARVAPSRASVLIRGESGTGKEVIARAIHYASPRSESPFVPFNVAALSPTLIESELFGHEKGAFTGADRAREGRFTQAHTGTLFIDEIGDIPVELQAKFLRVLQDNVIERIGGNRPFEVDIRIIAATNRNLEKMINEGAFREDLYYRLNVVSLYLPPLRERKEDILPLCDLFIKRYSSENKKQIDGFTRESFDALMKHDFPGNVRELENMIERAVVLARDTKITLEDLPPNIFARPSAVEADESGSLDTQVEALEKHLIRTELSRAGGNQSKAARALRISERKLRYKLAKYGLI
ncbi:sigma-54-dependent transcriptional regulator [candidate division KSB1 bacterium]